jgi:hypothetical protein
MTLIQVSLGIRDTAPRGFASRMHPRSLEPRVDRFRHLVHSGRSRVRKKTSSQTVLPIDPPPTRCARWKFILRLRLTHRIRGVRSAPFEKKPMMCRLNSLTLPARNFPIDSASGKGLLECHQVLSWDGFAIGEVPRFDA